MPRLSSETVGTGDQSWLGSTHGLYNAQTVTIDISAFTAGTHYPDGYIPSGTPVNVADRDAVVPFTDTAGAALAFVKIDTPVVGDDDFGVAVIEHGFIKIDNLPVAFTVPATADTGQFVFMDGVS